MPGIVGIISDPSARNTGLVLGQMIQPMIHEPFYTSGSYVNEALGVGVGWVSHPGSFAASMPVWNRTRDVCLVFSGEDFANSAESEHSRATGTYEDNRASYLVRRYEELGPGFLERLNGWFSGLVVDLRERKVILFNDRFGLHRLYYHQHANGLYFSSEAKSLLKALPELREVDATSLAETFSCGCVLQDRTLFKRITLLPGASVWTFNPDRTVRKTRYFNPQQWEQLPALSSAEYSDRLADTLARILPSYIDGPEKVAMSLTGGLDGRMIMAWARVAPGQLPCYTFGGTYRDCADVRIARRVAQVCRQQHETLVAGEPRFFAEFPSLAEKAVHISDGTMDVTGAVELYVNKAARTIAPIRLTGNYGSEIVRGNVAFRPHSFNEGVLDPVFASLLQSASSTYDLEREVHPLSFIAFKQVPWYHYSRLAVESSQLTLRSPYLDNELVSLIYQAPPELVRSIEPSLRAISQGNPRLALMSTDRGLRYRPIPMVSKAHHVYQELTVRAEYAYDYGMPQWVARIDHMLAPLHLERLFLGRHKFYHFRVWYRDRLAQYLKDTLLDPRALNRAYMNRRALEQMVSAHTSGTRNYTSELHRLLTAELFHRSLIDHA